MHPKSVNPLATVGICKAREVSQDTKSFRTDIQARISCGYVPWHRVHVVKHVRCGEVLAGLLVRAWLL